MGNRRVRGARRAGGVIVMDARIFRLPITLTREVGAHLISLRAWSFSIEKTFRRADAGVTRAQLHVWHSSTPGLAGHVADVAFLDGALPATASFEALLDACRFGEGGKAWMHVRLVPVAAGITSPRAFFLPHLHAATNRRSTDR